MKYESIINKYILTIIVLCFTVTTSLYILNNVPVNNVYAQQNVTTNQTSLDVDKQIVQDNNKTHLGVNMRGYYTSMPQSRDFKFPFPDNYYDTSFKDISKANIVDHVRYRFYWESYVRNSSAFLKEIEDVAKTADKYGIKVVYDNHQFHTSSWLNAGRGTGFPPFFFTDHALYEQDSGGTPKSAVSQTWWTNWWNNAMTVNGTDGWTLQLEFLKKIVNITDKHPSTLGYEILSEPQVHSEDQWAKIGKYNTFMTDELRKLTNKTIIYSMNIPIDLKSSINVNAANLAKMTPQNKQNVVFKFSLYGIPDDGYQSDKLQLFENASRIAGVPLYIGEWNNVKRVETYNDHGEKIWVIDDVQSDISQADANAIVGKFRDIGIWGLAYWEWSFVPNDTPNFNLVNVTSDKVTGKETMQPTEYFKIIENAYKELFVQQPNAVPTSKLG
ncbi:MAG: hypothetical protein WCE93_03540 [Nitrososphaeraceae archaeon]